MDFLGSFQPLIPKEFINTFVDKDHFKRWLQGGDINDLKEILKQFEKDELYEHCRIIQMVIDEKCDDLLNMYFYEEDDD